MAIVRIIHSASYSSLCTGGVIAGSSSGQQDESSSGDVQTSSPQRELAEGDENNSPTTDPQSSSVNIEGINQEGLEDEVGSSGLFFDRLPRATLH